MRVQGGVLTICTLLSVNFGIATFASAEKVGDVGERRCHSQNVTGKSNVKGALALSFLRALSIWNNGTRREGYVRSSTDG
jgi:hypothetical protein